MSSRLLALLLGLLWAGMASAHKASTSYLRLNVQAAQVTGRWDISLRDLDYALGLDANNDAALTWGEVRGQEGRIADYALARLQLSADRAACTLAVRQLQIIEHSDGRYASLALAGQCPHEPVSLALAYSLLFDLDALHRGLLNLEFRGSHSGIFGPQSTSLRFSAAGASSTSVFRQYFHEGLWHVWTGLDHMLFLAGLFLPAVLRRSGRQWLPAESLRSAFAQSAVMVTAFTFAHALTLTLAATGVFSPPTRWVESGVALSVLFAGANNLLPMVYRGLFFVAAGFGLIHGAAIAGGLIELGLPPGGRVWALLAFNLGVEAAQLAVLLAVLPPSFLLRKFAAYRWLVLLPGSAFIAFAGFVWLLQRGLNIDLGVGWLRSS